MKFKPQFHMIYVLRFFTLTFILFGFYGHKNISASVKR